MNIYLLYDQLWAFRLLFDGLGDYEMLNSNRCDLQFATRSLSDARNKELLLITYFDTTRLDYTISLLLLTGRIMIIR